MHRNMSVDIRNSAIPVECNLPVAYRSRIFFRGEVVEKSQAQVFVHYVFLANIAIFQVAEQKVSERARFVAVCTLPGLFI
jgi:hypothetical protein